MRGYSGLSRTQRGCLHNRPKARAAAKKQEAKERKKGVWILVWVTKKERKNILKGKLPKDILNTLEQAIEEEDKE